MLRRGMSLAISSLAAVALAGCLPSPVPREPLPPSQIETASIPGFEHVRVWGDENSTVFSDAVLAKDRQLLAAARAGRVPDGETRATFLAILAAATRALSRPACCTGGPSAAIARSSRS